MIDFKDDAEAKKIILTAISFFKTKDMFVKTILKHEGIKDLKVFRRGVLDKLRTEEDKDFHKLMAIFEKSGTYKLEFIISLGFLSLMGKNYETLEKSVKDSEIATKLLDMIKKEFPDNFRDFIEKEFLK
jgi:hypothetical protein